MLQTGQLVTTPDGSSGKIVAAAAHDAPSRSGLIDENHVTVQAVLIGGGEVRWYVADTLKPLEWGPSGAGGDSGAGTVGARSRTSRG